MKAWETNMKCLNKVLDSEAFSETRREIVETTTEYYTYIVDTLKIDRWEVRDFLEKNDLYICGIICFESNTKCSFLTNGY